MDELVKSVQVHATRALEVFNDQPKHIQLALGASLAVVCLKLVWRPRRIKIQGRRAVVTGAGSGIGQEVARMLAKRGWRVYACDVNTAGLEKLSEFPNVVKCTVDVSSAESCQKMIKEVSADGASLDAVINVAGIVQQMPAGSVDDARTRQLFEINTFGPMRLCRELMPVMIRSPRGGWIVNITSIGGKVAWLWTGIYSPAKAALNLYSDSLRREAKANNLPIRVTVIAPGPVFTPLVHRFAENMHNWANAHPDDPFMPGIRREAQFQDFLERIGGGVDQVSVSPQYVAQHVIDAVESESPPSYIFVAKLAFKLLILCVNWLPTDLGDRLMIAL